MESLAVYGGLLLSAFASATVLPGTSEAAMVLLLNEGKGTPLLLLLVATAGNVLGSVLNWLLGRFFSAYRDRRWFPIKEKTFNRVHDWYERYGRWSLLLAWAPFIGDALTLVAGTFRVNFWFFLLLVTIGKGARYLFVLQAAQLVID
ncbi:MAG: hypothetical protein CMN55_14340 [Sneathiella sp.]|jgi:membrane protein YqaA with SNARE-associated domain|uniref:YqaA family protein n=1 Tax=Sneathiella sp. TaxID=1964365 RepID=UPI000C60C8D6|nr:YqaA family protein [Sneathiella sp.]MAL80263.1 hypothetical protein [Sneathiella sp.]